MNKKWLKKKKPVRSIESMEEVSCKNCETVFKGNYCPNCGQSTKEFDQPFRFMVVDFMATMVAFDTRLLKTLKAVLFNPGQLSRDFINGKRVQYMPPFRFYIFISFVLFFLLSQITSKSLKNNEDMFVISDNKDTEVVIQKDSLINNITSDDSILFDKESVQEKNIKKKVEKLIEYPETYIDKVLQFGSWSFFILMPVFAFLLWLVFRKSEPYYIYHFTYSVNIHAFAFTIVSVLLLLQLTFGHNVSSPALFLILIIPVYQIVGAKKLFRQSIRKTIFKLVLVWMAYSFFWLIMVIAIAAIAFQAF